MSDWRSLGASSVASSGVAVRYVMRPDVETGGQSDGGVEGVIEGSVRWAENGRDQPCPVGMEARGMGVQKTGVLSHTLKHSRGLLARVSFNWVICPTASSQ
jgi:hypothetical protein